MELGLFTTYRDRTSLLQSPSKPLDLVAVRVDPEQRGRRLLIRRVGIAGRAPRLQMCFRKRDCCSRSRRPSTSARQAACLAAGWHEVVRDPGLVPAQGHSRPMASVIKQAFRAEAVSRPAQRLTLAPLCWHVLSRGAPAAPDWIAREVEASLQRLRTDHIDLYQAHRDDGATPLEDTLGAFALLIEQGKVRAIGASNYTAPPAAGGAACQRPARPAALRVAATALQPAGASGLRGRARRSLPRRGLERLSKPAL